jgi:hypothetical protein
MRENWTDSVLHLIFLCLSDWVSLKYIPNELAGTRTELVP